MDESRPWVGGVVVVDTQPIFRRGLVACLAGLDGVEWVEGVASVAEAHTRGCLNETDLVLIDPDVEGALELVADLTQHDWPRVVVCSDSACPELVRASIVAGAIGFLSKATLRPETLLATLLASASGSTILAAGLLNTLATQRPAGSVPSPEPSPAALPSPTALPSPLTPREHSVLALIADGEPAREVARQLAYSERTVKNVLHDVVVKLGARSRSHAIAHAVRYGII